MTACGGLRRLPGSGGGGGTVSLVIAATVYSVMPWHLTAALGVKVNDDISLSPAGLGLLVFIFGLSAASLSYPLGMFVERAGVKTSIRLAALVTGVSMLSMALIADSWLHLAVLFGVAGAAASLAQPASNSLVASGVPSGRQGIAFGLKQAGVPIGSLAAGVLVASLGDHVGWRTILFGAALCMTGAIYGGTRIMASATRSDAALLRRPGSSLSVALCLVTLSALLGSAGATPVVTFAVAGSVAQGMSQRSAGVALAIASLLAVVARIMLGWRADHRVRAGLRTPSMLLAIGASGLSLMAVTADTTWFSLGLLIAGGAGWGWNGLVHHAVVRSHLQRPAAASGVVQAGFFLGAALGPLCFGAIASRTGFSAAWSSAAVVMATAAALALAAGPRVERLAQQSDLSSSGVA